MSDMTEFIKEFTTIRIKLLMQMMLQQIDDRKKLLHLRTVLEIENDDRVIIDDIHGILKMYYALKKELKKNS